MNITQIAFGVVGNDFWAQFTSKIKLQFFYFSPAPPLVWTQTQSSSITHTIAVDKKRYQGDSKWHDG